MKKALIVLNNYETLFGPAERLRLRELVDVYAPPQRHTIMADCPELLASTPADAALASIPVHSGAQDFHA